MVWIESTNLSGHHVSDSAAIMAYSNDDENVHLDMLSLPSLPCMTAFDTDSYPIRIDNHSSYWEMLDTHFYFVFAHIILYCFLCHIYDFFQICCVTFIRIVVIVRTIGCLLAVFHFRFLNRTYQRIYRISTECINGVINDHMTIVYLCFLRMRCGKRHHHERYVVNYSV